MAIIYSYPPVASLQTTDLFIISRVPTDPDEISNFSVTADAFATFVTARVNLNFLGDTGTGIVNLDTQNLSVIGTTNEIETTASSQTLQIGLPDNVTIANNLTVVNDVKIDSLTSGYIPFVSQTAAGGALRNSNFFQVDAPVTESNAVGLNTTKLASVFGEYPDLRVAGKGFFGNVPGVLDLFRKDGDVQAGDKVGILQYSVDDDAQYAVAQIEVKTLGQSGTGNSGGGKLCIKTSKNESGAQPTERLCIDDTEADFSVPINVTTANRSSFVGQVTIPLTPVANTDAASKGYVDAQNTGQVTGTGTTNVLPIWTDGPNSDLGDSLITQTKIDGGTIFDLNAITTGPYTPAVNTKLLDLNSGGTQKFSITQDGGGGVVLPSGGGVTNPGPSFNMGGGAFSNGKSGVAMGSSTTAFGNGSLAANFLTLASGGGASAFGLLTEAAALASTAFGNKSVASGNYSIAAGQDSIASGQSSVAIGEKGVAQGKNTFVSGFGGTAIGNNAVKFGYEGSAAGNNSAKFGFESVAIAPNSFAIGNGTTASGSQSIATGENTTVDRNNSFVGGKNSFVGGSESIAYGISNNIFANTSAIFGNLNTITSGSFQSFIAGTDNTTNSFGEVKLIGRGLVAASQEGVYLGKYNDDLDNYNKFQIGNGSGGNNKSNSLSINNAGHIKLPTYGSGTVTGTATRNLSVDADGRIIETANPTVPDYLSFVCLLSQSGAANPQPNLVLENSLGIPTPFTAFTRVSSGEYNLSATGKFKLLKTIVFINGGSAENNHDVAWEVIDADNLRIRTHNSDDKLTKASLEIRTYN
jgi:hypothetical protein